MNNPTIGNKNNINIDIKHNIGPTFSCTDVVTKQLQLLQ